MTKKLTLLTFAYVLLLSAPAFAHCGMCGMEGEHKDSMKSKMEAMKVDMLSEELGLSEDQAAKLKELLKTKKEKMKSARDAYQSDLKNLLNEEQIKRRTN